MTNLFNTVGNIKFYNKISNTYFAGIPSASINGTTEAPRISVLNWIDDYLYPGTTFAGGRQVNGTFGSTEEMFMYIPPAVGTPTENETIAAGTTTSTSNNYRWELEMDYNPHLPGVGSNQRIKMNGIDAGAGDNLYVEINPLDFFSATTTYITDREDYVAFCVASPTTIVMSTIKMDVALGGKLNENFERSYTFVIGWMHDSIYPAPPATEAYRYNSCYCLAVRSLPTSRDGMIARVPTQKALAGTNDTNYENLLYGYYDISCQSGSYTPGLFLTDYVFIKNSSPFTKYGKMDNEVACVGRGNFELGRVYEATDVFGRTGVEYWLCIQRLVPDSVTINTGDATWLPGELDFLMQRVFTEAA